MSEFSPPSEYAINETAVNAELLPAFVDDSASRAISRTLEEAHVRDGIERQIDSADLPIKVKSPKLKMALAAGIFALGMSPSEALGEDVSAGQELTPTQQSAVEQVTGKPFAESRDKFDIQVPIEPDASGRYIVHVGQTHRSSGEPTSRIVTQQTVVNAQASIEGLLASTIDTNKLQCLFAEGVADEQILHSNRDLIKRASRVLDRLKTEPIDNFDKLKKNEDTLNIIANILKHPQAYHYLAASFDEARSHLAHELDNDDLAKTDVEKAHMEMFKISHVFQEQITESNPLQEEANNYTVGAYFKLFMDRRVPSVCPTEDDALNKQTYQAIGVKDQARIDYQGAWLEKLKKGREENPDFQRAWDTRVNLLKKGETSWTPEDRAESETALAIIQKISEEYKQDPHLKSLKEKEDQAESVYEKLQREREDEILRKIDIKDQEAISRGEKPNHALVVYGVSHDLTRAVSDWNAHNLPDAPDRGYMKFQLK